MIDHSIRKEIGSLYVKPKIFHKKQDTDTNELKKPILAGWLKTEKNLLMFESILEMVP